MITIRFAVEYPAGQKVFNRYGCPKIGFDLEPDAGKDMLPETFDILRVQAVKQIFGKLLTS